MYSSLGVRRLNTSRLLSGPRTLCDPTIPGSCPGVISAGSWAVLISMGRKGYIECTEKIIKASRYIREEVFKLENIKIVKDPVMTVLVRIRHFKHTRYRQRYG